MLSVLIKMEQVKRSVAFLFVLIVFHPSVSVNIIIIINKRLTRKHFKVRDTKS